MRILDDKSPSSFVAQDLFPFLSNQTGAVIPRDHVVLQMESGSRHILLADHPEFVRRISRLSTRTIKKISIFAHEKDRVDRLIEQLRENGIKYKEDFDWRITQSDIQASMEKKLEQRIDRTLCRLPAKIAFNYFCWSVQNKSGIGAVYDPRFDAIRNFILNDDGPNPVSVSDDSLASTDGTIAPASLTHLVVWRKDKGFLIGEVGLFAVLRYSVILGQAPPYPLIPPGHGYGHIFDLNDRSFRELEVEIGPLPTVPDDQLPPNWGVQFLPPDMPNT